MQECFYPQSPFSCPSVIISDTYCAWPHALWVEARPPVRIRRFDYDSYRDRVENHIYHQYLLTFWLTGSALAVPASWDRSSLFTSTIRSEKTFSMDGMSITSQTSISTIKRTGSFQNVGPIDRLAAITRGRHLSWSESENFFPIMTKHPTFVLISRRIADSGYS